MRKKAIIIGAGPAGLTAAYELLERSDVIPVVFEMTGDIGGISKTVNHNGNRIDIGGHRFFSKSARVMDWWQRILPAQGPNPGDGPDPEQTDRVMLVRSRLSRILFGQRLYDYPLSLSPATLMRLGLGRTARIGAGYLHARLFPRKPEKSLEDFFINRFGKTLYETFFRDYTQKVWGVPCSKIEPEWGAQRVKGLSIGRAVAHALKAAFRRDTSLAQKSTETSLIERFLYPKYGPGQMWEEVARTVRKKGGEILLRNRIVGLQLTKGRASSVIVKDDATKETREVSGDYVFSTMPVKELVAGMVHDVPDEVRRVAQGLKYRDFITVGLLLKEAYEPGSSGSRRRLPDNWIYVQEPDVRLARIQVFNNWSPYMVCDPTRIWVGLEYLCNRDDDLWAMPDQQLVGLAAGEIAATGITRESAVLDSVVIRMPNTYPSYIGPYRDFHVIREYVDRFSNLFLIGRNGMHRYNNTDHSMLTAMAAVDCVLGTASKRDIWLVNAEDAYHE